MQWAALFGTDPALASFEEAFELLVPRRGKFWIHNGTQWLKADKTLAPELLAAAMCAGVLKEPQTLRGFRHQVVAVGAAVSNPAQTVRYADLDLDGGTRDGIHYDPAKVLKALKDTAGIVPSLVTSGSGATGRVHALFHIEPTTVSAVQAFFTDKLASAGFPPTRGGAEVYPSTSNCRLPGSLTGVVVWNGSFTRENRAHPLWIVKRLIDAAPLAVPLTTKGKPSPSAKPKRTAKRHPRISLDRYRRGREIWEDGVSGIGMRHESYPPLVAYLRCGRGLNEERTVEWLTGWIQRGGIAKSRGNVRRELRDLPSRVARLYATAQAPPPIRPVHLSASELTDIVVWVGRLVSTRDERAEMFGFLYHALRYWKGLWHAGVETRWELPAAEWERFAGSSSDRRAALLRETAALWLTGTYRIADPSIEDDLGKALDFSCIFPFDTPDKTPPARPLLSGAPPSNEGLRSNRRLLQRAINLAVLHVAGCKMQASEIRSLFHIPPGHKYVVRGSSGGAGTAKKRTAGYSVQMPKLRELSAEAAEALPPVDDVRERRGERAMELMGWVGAWMHVESRRRGDPELPLLAAG